MRLIRKLNFFVLIACLLLLGGAVSLQAQEVQDLGQQEELALKREVLLLQERLRLLYSQGQYEEVISEANRLMEMDPGNSTAVLVKDLAERRIAEGDVEPPTSPGSLNTETVDMESSGAREFIEAAGGSVESAEPEQKSAEDLLIERAMSGGGMTMGGGSFNSDDPEASGGSNNSGPQSLGSLLGAGSGFSREKEFSLMIFLLAMTGLIAFIALAGGAIVWLRAKDVAPQEASATAASVGRALAISDLPTAQQDQITARQSGAGQYKTPSSAQEEEHHTAVHDLVTRPEIAYEDEEEEQAEPEAPEAPAPHQARVSSVALDISQYEEGNPEEVSSLGIDYSETDNAEFHASQALDIDQTQGDPFRSAPPEPVSQPEPAGQEQSAYDDDDSVKLDMDIAPPTAEPEPAGQPRDSFAPQPPEEYEEDEETAVADDSFLAGVAGTGPTMEDEKTAINFGTPGEDEDDEMSSTMAADLPTNLEQQEYADANDQTYNSLMFGGAPATEHDNSGDVSPDQGTQIDDITVNTFNNQYDNVMFGSGADETKVDDGIAPKPTASTSSEETVLEGATGDGIGDTVNLEDDQKPTHLEERTISSEETVMDNAATAPIPGKKEAEPVAAGGGQKLSMFDRQLQAGQAAMDEGNYGKAVQCLSVAASLKPGNKEVRAMLEEARQKRRSNS